jgi:hypothetical protein
MEVDDRPEAAMRRHPRPEQDPLLTDSVSRQITALDEILV